MFCVTFSEFNQAVEILGLIGVETKDDIKKRYLKLSREYHPDMNNGSTEKFQEINEAYKILSKYVDSFKFRFTKEEFGNQHPFSVGDTEWLHKPKNT
ncbi:J domain-containing protein [Candidatus Sulfurimonas marisnigri]|uniref:J domain-containing protein n=1 Tax=Candidatus Sulfurimonas marisnigri TaxID=2740405 RepID=A0A7S7LYG4_9BACT|nr:J domain-containing protein [Candidatus Sulfurimonas marisnigri]QOY53736.1 J domain-containing protein [Candidatus Sulfurimonas marisnigri]